MKNKVKKYIYILFVCVFLCSNVATVYGEEAEQGKATQEEEAETDQEDTEEADEEEEADAADEENSEEESDEKETKEEAPDKDKETAADNEPTGEDVDASETDNVENENAEDPGSEEKAGELTEEPGKETNGELEQSEENAKETKKIILSFYSVSEEGEEYLLAEEEADEQGCVSFPEVPELETFTFSGWETENGEAVDEDTVFCENTKIYAVWLPNETEESKTPMLMSLARSSSNIGISESHPEEGQENRYEYTGSEEEWTVPVTGYYSIYCYGAQGGNGYSTGHSSTSGGTGTATNTYIKLIKNEILSVSVGAQGGRQTGGYPDGGTGEKAKFSANSTNECAGHVNYGGGGGGSSYVKKNSIKIASAKGGNGANMHKCSNDQAEADGGRGGGENIGNLIGNSSGNGYILITLDEICLGVSLDAPTDWTNQDVKITAGIISEGEGLPEKYLSWETDEEGNDIWTDMTEYTVSQNGTYTCKIRDTAGNIEETTIEITNIDRLEPEGEITADITDWTRENVQLTAAADDAEETTAYGKSGLMEKAYLWGEKSEAGENVYEQTEMVDAVTGETRSEEAWTDAPAYTASQNGTYLCRIRDKAGNETVCEYIVTNIDRTAPEIICDRPGKWYEGDTTVTWQGKDIQPDGSMGCGLHAQAYSFNGVDWTDNNVQGIPSAGIYKIWVRDALGNIGEYEIEIDYDDRPKEGKGEVILQPIVPEPLPEPVISDAGEDDGDGAFLIPTYPTEPTPVAIPKKIEMPVLLQVKEEAAEIIEFPKTPKKSEPEGTGKIYTETSSHALPPERSGVPEVIIKSAVISSSSGIIYFVCFYMIRSAGIMAMNADGEYVFLGRRRIVKRNGNYRIRLDSYLCSKADTEKFQIVPGRQFAKKNIGKVLVINYKNETLQIEIAREIKVDIPLQI